MNTINIKALSEQVSKLSSGSGSGLPDVGPEDAGQVLMVGDTGEWEADEITGLLPDVDQSDEGSILKVNSSGKWVASKDIELPTLRVKTESSSSPYSISVDGVVHTQEDFPMTVKGINISVVSSRWTFTSTRPVIFGTSIKNPLNESVAITGSFDYTLYTL